MTTNIPSLISFVLTCVLALRVCNGQHACFDPGDLAIDLWRECVEANEGDAAEVIVGFDLLYFFLRRLLFLKELHSSSDTLYRIKFPPIRFQVDDTHN